MVYRCKTHFYTSPWRAHMLAGELTSMCGWGPWPAQLPASQLPLHSQSGCVCHKFTSAHGHSHSWSVQKDAQRE